MSNFQRKVTVLPPYAETPAGTVERARHFIADKSFGKEAVAVTMLLTFDDGTVHVLHDCGETSTSERYTYEGAVLTRYAFGAE